MPAGRPLSLTPGVIAQVKQLLPRALYFETVAASIGVHRLTFRKWLRDGAKETRRREQGHDPDPKLDLHCELSNTVQKVLAETETDYLSQIQAAGTQAWTAVAWILERRFPGKWSQNRAELRQLKRQVEELVKRGGGGARTGPRTPDPGEDGDEPVTVEEVK